MQKNVTTILLAILLAQGFAYANSPSISWKINHGNTPITSIDFPMTITEAKPEERFYYAYQFGFTGGGDIGYTGIQPQPDAGGKTQYRIVFSSFRPDSHPQHHNCDAGADNGPGASCATIIDGKPGTTYKLHVAKEGSSVTGSVIDTSTGKSTVVGKWSVDPYAGDLASSEIAWVENYALNSPDVVLECNANGWPHYEVTYGAPVANNGTLSGTISDLSPDGWDDIVQCRDVPLTVRHPDDQYTTVSAGYQSGSQSPGTHRTTMMMAR